VRRSAEWTMNEAQLATLVSRDSMIGTGIPTV
jgi:hypothetical protein